MIKKYKILLIFCVLVAATSCVTTRQLNYFQKSGMGIPKYTDSVGYEEYKLQKGDYLYIKVYTVKKEDMDIFNDGQNANYTNYTDNATYRLFLYLIEEDGYFEYPYAGQIYALGKTSRELKYEMEKLLKDVLSHFSVDVKLANRTFSIITDTKSQRVQIPAEKMTIFQALAISGDLSQYSDRSKIKLVRQTEEGTIVKIFDLRPKSIIDSEFYYVQPNDVLYVQHTFAKHFGIDHITTAITTTLGTVSLGLIIYTVEEKIRTEYNKRHPKTTITTPTGDE